MARDDRPVLSESLANDPKLTLAQEHMRVDPEDFEQECRRLVAELPPCRVCFARVLVGLDGRLHQDHDLERHGAAHDWTPRRATHARRALRPRDPLDD